MDTTELHKKLYLDSDMWENIPDDLLLIAFRSKKNNLTVEESKRLIREYGYDNMSIFEWIGDSVLELYITNLLVGKNIQTRRDMNLIRSKMSSSETLYYFLESNDLLSHLEETNIVDPIKDSSKCFQSVIGMLYFYLDRNDLFCPFSFMTDYLDKWFTKERVEIMINGGSLALVEPKISFTEAEEIKLNSLLIEKIPKIKTQRWNRNVIARYNTISSNPQWWLPHYHRYLESSDYVQTLSYIYTQLGLDFSKAMIVIFGLSNFDKKGAGIVMWEINLANKTMELNDDLYTGRNLQVAKQKACKSLLEKFFAPFLKN